MSSSLILPKSQVNFIEANLAALFKRYPHERERLEAELRKPAPIYPLVHQDLPDPPKKPAPRVILLTGIANPMFLAAILNNKVINKETFKLFIFEQNLQFLAFMFQQTDITQIINSPKTEWFLAHDIHSVKPALYRALEPEAVASLMFNVQAVNFNKNPPEAEWEFYSKIEHVYVESCQHIIHNHGNTDDSLFGVELTVKNKDFILNSPGIEDLQNCFKDKTALIVGAGPTLDGMLDDLKKYNDRFVVIAVDAALKPLRAHGIRVDYVTSIERSNEYQIPFFTGMEKEEAELVAYPVVHPVVLSTYPGPVRLVYRNYSFYAYFEKNYPKGVLKSGGSTAHLAVRLADYLGCSKICFVALDSCYEEKDGLFRTHCKGTGYPEWADYLSIDDLMKVRNHLPAIKARTNSGQLALTNMTYYQWVKEYADELAKLNRVSFINCSLEGLAVSGVPYKSLQEVGEAEPVLDVKKPVPGKSYFYRQWDHKELVKNFKGWLQLCEESLAECDALLQMNESEIRDRYYGVFYVYTCRLILENLFVSFVIQCCAKDYFLSDNDWWALSSDFDEDMLLKTRVLKRKFEIFIPTLTKLIDLFGGEA